VKRLLRCGAAVAVVPLVVSLSAGSAQADETGEAVRPLRDVIISGAAIDSKTADAADVTGAQREKVQQFLEEQARVGHLVDESDVKITVVESPLGRGEVGVISDSSRSLEGLRFTQLEDNEKESDVLYGLKLEPTEQSEDEPGSGSEDDIDYASTGGVGYGAAFGTKNLSKKGGGCLTHYWNPEYDHEKDHWETDCFEKFHDVGTRNWIYNRYAIFTKAANTGGIGGQSRTQLFTIRSRPWKGKADRVSSLVNWTPAQGATNCSEAANATLTAGPASLAFPIHRCNKTEVLPEANKRSMGIEFTGNEDGQVRLDFAMHIKAKNTTIEPSFSDYAYAEVHWCYLWINCPGSSKFHKVLWTDAGW